MDNVVVIDTEHYDFVQRNGTWVLSVLAVMMSCIAAILGYFLRSRCTRIQCCGMECERQVLDLTQENDLSVRVRSEV
jgi:hypothetical protein